MATRHDSKNTPRPALSRERVLSAAVALADESGLKALSMRKLGQRLGVEAMSLYNHVKNKDEILDGIVDRVVSEIEVPAAGDDWKIAMRDRAASCHDVLLRHPWACTLIESRTNLGPARLRYFDSVIGSLRRAGFSIELAYNAFLAIDSYVYGFTLQEISWPFEKQERRDVAASMQPQIPAEYPHIAEIMGYVMRSSTADPASDGNDEATYEAEFTFGLDLILDGLDKLRHA